VEGGSSSGGAAQSDGGGGLPDSGGHSGGSTVTGGGGGHGGGEGGEGATPPEPNPACAERSWEVEQPVAGPNYLDYVEHFPKGVSVAGDGSAFIAWLSSDATSSYVYANASRYRPTMGWQPALRFDHWDWTYSPESGVPGEAPAVAASENGEAMLVWAPGRTAAGPLPAGSLISVHYDAGDWQTPVPIQSIEASAAGLTVGADAHGNFVAAWVSTDADGLAVKMVRYTRGTGWGTTERVADYLPPGIHLSTAPNGTALVAWADSGDVVAERFDPSAGWSGPELLEDALPPLPQIPAGAVGSDGSAAVAWTTGSAQKWHPIARAFSGTWSSAANLDGAAEGGMINPRIDIATDSHGTFIAAWGEPQGAYVSQLAPGGMWSPRTSVSAPAAVAAGDNKDATGIAMNESGDAVVGWIEWTQQSHTSDLFAATYAPNNGWTAPTPLDHANTLGAERPTMDPCGNAGLAWSALDKVKAARRVGGGDWSTSSPLGSGNLIAFGAGSNGAAIASWYSLGEGLRLSASALTGPQLEP
jgi:hypothetical protein